MKKKIEKEVSAYFKEMAKKSWEVRKKKILAKVAESNQEIICPKKK